MHNKQNPVRVEAKTLDQALVKASGTLGVTQDRLAYEIIKKSGGGLLGFFTGSKVEISAWVRSDQGERRSHNRRNDRNGDRSNSRRDNGRRDGGRRRDDQRTGARVDTRRNEYANGSSAHLNGADADEVAASAPKRDLTPDELTALRQELTEFCKGICERMAGESVEVTSELDGDRLTLNLDNEYLTDQILKNTRLAESLEHILRKKPRHLRQELPYRIFVDVRGSRRARETELVQMAQDLSMKVAENKRPIVLNYKSAYDRKIIHMALDSDERVYTKSIGSGPNRKLMILPSSGQPMGEPSELHG